MLKNQLYIHPRSDFIHTIHFHFMYKVQSSTKAMVKELIYEAKYQSSARPGGP